MYTLVNKTARVINVDGLTLIPGVAQKVGDVSSLLSVYPGFKAQVDDGEVVIKKLTPAKTDTKAVPKIETEVKAEVTASQDEPKPKRRTVRKKE